jgi:superfamily II DNA or RNA helicase
MREKIQHEGFTTAINHNRSTLAISMGVGKTLVAIKYLDYCLNVLKLKKFLVTIPLPAKKTWLAEASKHGYDHLLSYITFTTYRSLVKNSTDYDVLILDEVHNIKYSHDVWLSLFGGKILGLTGTPPTHPKNEKFIMIAKYCPLRYTYLTEEAVSDKILNNYNIYVHLLDLDKRKNKLIKSKTAQWYTSEEDSYMYWSGRILISEGLEKHKFSIMRMKSLMDNKSKEDYASKLFRSQTEKTILFCNSKEQASRLYPYSYYSGNPKSKENLELFNSGVIDKITCIHQLSESINIKDLKVGIIMHAYGNEKKTSQRIGRLLRLLPEDEATIHILCYKDTVDQEWTNKSLEMFNKEKIKYIDVK